MKPRLTVVRKLSKHGNSWMLAPGRTFMNALGLVGGEYVELVLDEYSRRFYVKPLHSHARRRTPAPSATLPLEESR